MLHPLNRYLTVRPIERPKDEGATQVLVPDSYYEDSPSAYMMVEIVECHEESKLQSGMCLVAPRSAVEVIELDKETHYLLLETHVMGFFKEGE